MTLETFIAHTVSNFFSDHMCFQLYLQIVKISLHSIFATSVNTILIKQDYKLHARYIIGCFIV